ncbi:MAG: transcription termination/antitermination protein NusA [Candidatus Dadabacteria bacterium]|nr:MAG: transcription termination/antitermination protein NusA [Candidatus Dadabacteria bacterium]
MGFDLNALLNQIGKDKGIDKQILVEAIESATLSAARKQYGHNLNLETQFNEDTGMIEVMEFKTVVEEVEDPDTQISLEEARRLYDADAQVGDELGRKLDIKDLGRIAAQTAKQVIIQKVRDAERGVIYNEYVGRKGELINGIVQRYERGNLIVNLGRTDAVLPKREQIQKERYRRGDRLRSMILDVDPTARGPQIILTRSHPDFLKKLFELEVPEISEGVVEIKAVAREPGERAKIAVYSNDSGVDPVGACVGIKGSRVQAVVTELRGERIDIIVWSPDAPSFVARALSPAEITRVVMDEDERSMEVIVADDQLSLAIGRRGQNVKLASKLTGWKIDVRSISVVDEENRRARKSLERIEKLGLANAEMLFQEGYRSVAEVAEATVEDLMELESIDIDRELAEKIINSAKEAVEKMKQEGIVDEAEEKLSITDLDKLGLPVELKDRLIDAGFDTIQKLVIASEDDLGAIGKISEDEINIVTEACERFLRGRPRDDAI